MLALFAGFAHLMNQVVEHLRKQMGKVPRFFIVSLIVNKSQIKNTSTMNILLRKAILIVMLAIAAAPCLAQQRGTVSFGYDENGNRVLRSLQFKKMEENGKTVDDKSEFLAEANDVFGAMEVGLYPNPTSGRFTVSVNRNNDSSMPLHIVLSTQAGAVLFDKTLDSDMEDIDLSGQPSGIYFLRLNTSNESHVWKVVKK